MAYQFIHWTIHLFICDIIFDLAVSVLHTNSPWPATEKIILLLYLLIYLQLVKNAKLISLNM